MGSGVVVGVAVGIGVGVGGGVAVGRGVGVGGAGVDTSYGRLAWATVLTQWPFSTSLKITKLGMTTPPAAGQLPNAGKELKHHSSCFTNFTRMTRHPKLPSVSFSLRCGGQPPWINADGLFTLKMPLSVNVLPEPRPEQLLTERRVYEELADSDVPGQALYGVRATHNTPEVDFMVWEEDVASFAIEVKGGEYRLQHGNLFRITPEGPQSVPDLRTKTMHAAMSVRNAIPGQLDDDIFVIPVLLFPDMEEDPDILRWAHNHRTNIMLGGADLPNRLGRLDDVRTVRRPPTTQRIEQEVAVLTGEHHAARPAPAAQDFPAALQAQHVEIHNLVVNIYVTPAEPFSQPSAAADGELMNPEEGH